MGMLDTNYSNMLKAPMFDIGAGNNIAVNNSQSNTVRGNNQTTVNKSPDSVLGVSTAPASGVATAKPATLSDFAMPAMPTHDDITKSTVSNIIKSLTDQITADGKVDKSEFGQLMAFSKLLEDLLRGTANNSDGAAALGGNTPKAAGTPGVGGADRSRAPPESAQAVPQDAAQAAPAETAQADPKEAAQAAPKETAQSEPKEAAQTAPLNAAQLTANEEVPGEGEEEGEEEQETDLSDTGKNRQSDALQAESQRGRQAGVMGGSRAAREAYAQMKEAAMSDGKISAAEKKLLGEFAAKNGINDAEMSQGSNPAKGGNLARALNAALKDGDLSATEAKSLSALMDKGAGKGMSEGAKMAMAAKAFVDAEKNGKLSDREADLVSKILSTTSSSSGSNRLVAEDATPISRGSRGSRSGPPPVPQGPGLLELADQQLGKYIHPERSKKSVG